MEPLHNIPMHNHASVQLPPPFPSPPHPHHNSNNTTPSSKPALGHTPIVVETRLKKTPISFTAHFVGLSGYISADPNATIASPIIEAQDLSWTVHLSLNNSPYLGCGVYLESPNTTVRATYRLSLVNQMGWKNHFVSSDSVKTVTSTAAGRVLLCHEAKFISRDELKNAASGHCVDDTIMVMVELCIFSQEEKRILQAPPKPLGLTTCVDDETLKGSRHDHNGSLYDDMQALLFNRSCADVSIVIPSTSSASEDHEEAVDNGSRASLSDSLSIPAHSFVLALRSPVFRAMFQSNMLEAVSHQVVLHDCSEETVRDFLSFLYTDRCPSIQHHERQPLLAPAAGSSTTASSLPSQMHLHPDIADSADGSEEEAATTDRVEQLLMLACKYDVRRLQALCEQDLVERMKADNVASLLRLADDFGAARLKASALKFIATNATAVIGQASFFEHLSKELSCEVIRTMAGMRL